ncbi:uncharacterized protein AB675_9919 [Cyphellophora attinorum]|uniref:Uncharacterized protein n=1 Tax=Cyphellophora attinorum TaxID=1664694 RepID=A0A0N1GXW5_9EURO|nr:uncharacterized protein AB675_9919 [Phialophora attinorum]KPI35350.1 hypothetical protein AB675_9919 [Phialophora attinorum]
MWNAVRPLLPKLGDLLESAAEDVGLTIRPQDDPGDSDNVDPIADHMPWSRITADPSEITSLAIQTIAVLRPHVRYDEFKKDYNFKKGVVGDAQDSIVSISTKEGSLVLPGRSETWNLRGLDDLLFARPGDDPPIEALFEPRYDRRSGQTYLPTGWPGLYIAEQGQRRSRPG